MTYFLMLSILKLSMFNDCSSNSAFHEFHLSKCEIDFNDAEKTLEISIQLFLDDLELALANKGQSGLKFFSDDEHVEAESFLLAYIQEHLIVTVDGQAYPIQWLGKEISEDLAGVWCYLTIDNIDPKNILTVSNNVLMELFDDQRNIVKVKINPISKAYFLFEKGDSIGDLKIK